MKFDAFLPTAELLQLNLDLDFLNIVDSKPIQAEIVNVGKDSKNCQKYISCSIVKMCWHFNFPVGIVDSCTGNKINHYRVRTVTKRATGELLKFVTR